jgi:rhodanese-related sulfurtransferase
LIAGLVSYVGAIARAKINDVDAEPSIAQTTVAELPAEFGPGTVLLDVRENDEWTRGHAADARHIPMGEVPARLDEIDRSATLYVICKAGGRSAKVAQLLAHHGYEPINVAGGMLAWAEAGRPVLAADGGPGAI